MSYQDLPNDKKKDIKNFLHNFNNLLREHSLYINSSFSIENYFYGSLGLIEDDKNNLFLINEETYIEHASTEGKNE
jgi:hypothetical protein